MLTRPPGSLRTLVGMRPGGCARWQANNAALDIIECQLVDKLAIYLRHTFGEEQVLAGTAGYSVGQVLAGTAGYSVGSPKP
jgi:hypothetical protein